MYLNNTVFMIVSKVIQIYNIATHLEKFPCLCVEHVHQWYHLFFLDNPTKMTYIAHTYVDTHICKYIIHICTYACIYSTSHSQHHGCEYLTHTCIVWCSHRGVCHFLKSNTLCLKSLKSHLKLLKPHATKQKIKSEITENVS